MVVCVAACRIEGAARWLRVLPVAADLDRFGPSARHCQTGGTRIDPFPPIDSSSVFDSITAH